MFISLFTWFLCSLFSLRICQYIIWIFACLRGDLWAKVTLCPGTCDGAPLLLALNVTVNLDSGLSSLCMCFCCLHSFFIPKVFVLFTPYFFFLGQNKPFYFIKSHLYFRKTSCYSYWMSFFFLSFLKSFYRHLPTPNFILCDFLWCLVQCSSKLISKHKNHLESWYKHSFLTLLGSGSVGVGGAWSLVSLMVS